MTSSHKSSMRSQLQKIYRRTALLGLYHNDLSELGGKSLALMCRLKHHIANMRQSDEHFSMDDAKHFLKDVRDLLRNTSAEDLPNLKQFELKSYNLRHCKKAVQFLEEVKLTSDDEGKSDDNYPANETASGAQEQFLLLCRVSSVLARCTDKEQSRPKQLDSHWLLPILEELLRGGSVDEALDLRIESQKESIAAMISQLQQHEESISEAHKKIAVLASKNKALLSSCEEHAKCIATASEDVCSLQEKIVGTGDAVIEAVPHLRNELISAECLPQYNLLHERHEYTSRTPTDYSAATGDFSKILWKYDTKALSTSLDAVKEDFRKSYSTALLSLERLESPENRLKAKQQELLQLKYIWEDQPAQFCLDTLVQGRRLADWMLLLKEQPDD
ncbi:uncharacterized protein LOC135377636 isoform X2 [Ornithodoros turicata]|uniref:uncharacterized protein LOC135377636 isoform X2 n=1 Tax=Ornithodoros turicata TaxID=34597 RepID=UPI003138C1D5